MHHPVSTPAVMKQTGLHHEQSVLDAIVRDAVLPRLDALIPQQLSNLLWAVAVLEPQRHQQTFLQMSGAVLGRLDTFNAQDLSNAAWALAVVAGDCDWLKDAAPHFLCAAIKDHGCLTHEGRAQLFQFFFVCGLYDGEAAQKLDPSSTRLLMDCKETFQQASQQSRDSELQRSVCRALESTGWFRSVLYEHYTADKLFGIDIAVQKEDGRWVAVEVDGPSHYTSTKPYQLVGATVLRNRMLARTGWTVVSIPFYEWYGVVGAETGRKIGYLRRKFLVPAGA
jgi:hypothetical protein